MTSAFPQPEPKRFRVRFGGEVIATAELRRVPVDAIKLDPAYQRGTSRQWVQTHMPYDERQAGALVLSDRAGGPYCIDGGHRLELAKASGVTHVNAFVLRDLSQTDEARLFTHYQRERRNLSSHDLLRADVTARDEDTLAMLAIVTNAGFHLAEKARDPRDIVAVDACRYIMRYGGDDLLARTLATVNDHWVGFSKALSGQVLKGIALFLHSAGEQPAFKGDVFSKVMGENAPLRILGYAQQNATKRISSTTSAGDVAEAIWGQYNKRVAKDKQLTPLTISGKRRPVRQPRLDTLPTSKSEGLASSRGTEIRRKK